MTAALKGLMLFGGGIPSLPVLENWSTEKRSHPPLFKLNAFQVYLLVPVHNLPTCGIYSSSPTDILPRES